MASDADPPVFPGLSLFPHNADYIPIPDAIPPDTLAHKWCQLDGDREKIHYTFKRWAFPGDYCEDALNRAIDASLKKYPEALEAFPEKSARDKKPFLKCKGCD